MNFQDKEIAEINKDDVNGIFKMVVECLCGEKCHRLLSETEQDLLSDLLNKGRTDGLNFAQFNELLLLVDQDRVSEAFFNFFFEKEKINLDELEEGIIKFRGFAMLRFGNFRFAYKQLVQKDEKQLKEALKPHCKSTDEVQKKFEARPPEAIKIQKIEKSKTWYNGYIAKKKYEKEAAHLRRLLEDKTNLSCSLSKNELLSLADKYGKMGKEIREVEQNALKNTDIYLIRDYMDVYIATSMRHKWEFEETFDFVNEVFSDESLKQLNLRHFDPTHSQCKNRIDKGLIDGLMLKRALCTIYMAQEVDTMGKDSELAATLAQGKPVIAYVPSIGINQHAKKIMKYPLDFFKLRFLILRAEGTFDDEDCKRELERCDSDFEDTIGNFIETLDIYRSSQPFSLWDEKEDEFKGKSKSFSKMCRLLAIAEHYSFESRARTLKNVHPLSIQVHLESGTANGVLVVRNSKQCASLLYKILTNSANFKIKHKRENDEGVTILEEEISECPFRVVTDYEKLTNSFWNFYLVSEQ